MAGQVIKRGEDTWLVRIFMGRDAQGKRRYMNKTVKGKKKDAEAYLSKTHTSISTGTFVEPTPLTVNEYFTRWLEVAARPRVTERTFEGYGDLLTRYVKPSTLGSMKLSDIRPLNIQQLYTAMQERGLSARTVRYLHAVLNSALKQAVRWEMLTRNPAESVNLPKQVRKEMQAFSPEEATRFLKAAATDRWGVVFAFALATGMHPEEYLGLQWKDIDFERGVLSVRRGLIWRGEGGGGTLANPKQRTVAVKSPCPLRCFALLWLTGDCKRQSD